MPSKPETVFKLDDLFEQLNRSFLQAARSLEREQQGIEWRDSPMVYHMPQMRLSMKLSLTHSDGRVKGVFTKVRTETEQELASTISIDVVAVPKSEQTRTTPPVGPVP